VQKLLLPSPEFISQTYPAPHGSVHNFLYYFVRLKDHFMNYTRAIWRIVTRDKEMAQRIEQQNQNKAMQEWLSSE
jgi:hypothetical protein